MQRCPLLPTAYGVLSSAVHLRAHLPQSCSSAVSGSQRKPVAYGLQGPHLDDDGDRQVHVVRVDQAHREARVAGERAVHRALTQHLTGR